MYQLALAHVSIPHSHLMLSDHIPMCAPGLSLVFTYVPIPGRVHFYARVSSSKVRSPKRSRLDASGVTIGSVLDSRLGSCGVMDELASGRNVLTGVALDPYS